MKNQLLKILAFSLVYLLSGCGTGSSSASDETTPLYRCNKSENNASIVKPSGVYTSVITAGAVENTHIQGGLVRVRWAELEPTADHYDFSAIEERLALLPEGKLWTLAIHGGWSSLDQSDPDLYDANKKALLDFEMSPAWLESTYGISTFSMEFRGVSVHMPKYWDNIVQQRLSTMLNAVATHYKNDSRLMLVYVPQMTSNGLEGHFNGVPYETLIFAAGIDPAQNNAEQDFEDIWVNAALEASQSTANAFDNKAIAFEVHEIIGRTSIPVRIMNGLLEPVFESRAGVGMWWISGKNTYQPDLVAALSEYTGDLYGQVISNSSQSDNFANNDYGEVFTQAKALCMRYIEPWNYEFENNTYNDLMDDFNMYTTDYFDSQTKK